MRNFKHLLAAAAIAASAVPMSAQFSGSGSASAAVDIPQSYGLFSIGYESASYNYKGGDDSFSTNGVALQYISASSISKTIPLYFEWGVRASLGFWSESDDEYDDYEVKLTTLNATIPLNIAYRLPIGETVAITPYTGLHAKGNIIASVKEVEHNDEESYNLFEKDNGDWKRFQFGWQIGARVSFDKFNIGLEYGLDFNEIAKKLKTSAFQVSIGVNI